MKHFKKYNYWIQAKGRQGVKEDSCKKMKKQDFWHNLGEEIGGPLYMALYRWLSQKAGNRKIYFLSRGGCYLYKVFKRHGSNNIEYLSLSEEYIAHLGELDGNELNEAIKADEQLMAFLHEDACVFACDWEGTLQYLIERIKKSMKCGTETTFYYAGICNTEKSRKHVHGMHYAAYLFDFYKNYALHPTSRSMPIYELFFPDMSGEGASADDGSITYNSERLLDGILDYISDGLSSGNETECPLEDAISPMLRLIDSPTNEESVKLGIAKKKKNKSNNMYAEYNLEDGQSIRNYYRWISYQNEHLEKRIELTYCPMFSVVIPVYNTVTEQLGECIESVLAQSYDNFELILVDDHSSWENVVPVLKSYEGNEKVRVIYRAENGHISAATNDGIAVAQGEFIAFMDCDDTVEPDALYEMAKKLNENPQLDFIYSDEDKITEDGKIRHRPFFKPDWSPDLYMCMNYTNHLSVYRTDIAKKIGGLRSAYNGSQDYDFTLRFMEHSSNKRVGHVSKVLYHWRERKESAALDVSAKNYTLNTARQAKENWLKRNNIKGQLEYVYIISQYRVLYEVEGNPLVSIVIPSKDNLDILRQCIDSIYAFTAYRNFEIIVVDNGSDDLNKENISKYLHSKNVLYIYEKEAFNFSKMCNKGTRYAKGEYFLFLNDDVEVFQPEWLENMLGHAQRPHVGAVGAKLFYPKTTKIQHAGVGNMQEGPGHNFCGNDDGQVYYFGLNWIEYNCIAVTGACLMVSSVKFWEINGFDESLPVSYNDVCLCFSLHEAGYYNVMRNDVVLYHYESYSRGYDYLDDAKILRLSKEREKLYLLFPNLTRKDPYLNKNLHLYGVSLELLTKCDFLQLSNLEKTVDAGQVSVDTIDVTEKNVRIVGWSYIEDVDITDRCLILEDLFGNSYQAPLLSTMRQDVVYAFGGNYRYQYSGFECILDKSVLRVDIMPYKIGILSQDNAGSKYITWWNKQSNVVRNTKSSPVMCINKGIENFTKLENCKDVRWYIDSIENKGSHCEIRGFAFQAGNKHHYYQKSLVLLDAENNALEFDVQDEERIDVAAAFPEQHFLYNTGFRCYILNDVLEPEVVYDVIIRLSNQFDMEDVRDVVTREKVVR